MRGTDHHPIVFVAARRSTSARTDMLAPNGLRVPVGPEVQEGDDEPETSLAGFRDEEPIFCMPLRDSRVSYRIRGGLKHREVLQQ